MQKRAKTTEGWVEPLSKQVHETKSKLERKEKSFTESAWVIKRLKKEIDVKNHELLGKAHLEANIAALQKCYDEEYKKNVSVDNYLPTIYTNF